MILMNAGGSSTIHVSGVLGGGDATGEHAQPGTSLIIAGNSSSSHMQLDNCLMTDGQLLAPTPVPTPEPLITPLPEITSSVVEIGELPTPPGEAIQPDPSPDVTPTSLPTPETTPAPDDAASPEAQPTPMPDAATPAEASEAGTP